MMGARVLAMRSVLLLGNYRPTLVLARELSATGVNVISGLDGCDRGAELSRHVSEIFDHPPLARDSDAFLRALQRLLAARPDIDCVLPVSEEYVRYFSEHDVQLPRHVHVAMVPGATVRMCLDKPLMMRLARDLDIPVAPFAEVLDLDALHSQADAIGYPLVVRLLDSTKRLFGEKAFTLNARDDLEARFPGWPSGQEGLLIQRHARGIRHNIYFAALNGKLRRIAHAVITRTDRIDGSGLAVDGVTIEPDIDLAAYTSRLAEALSYTGIGCAQFLVDSRTGEVSFLEINPRIAGNHSVPEMGGLSLGRFLVEASRGNGIVDARWHAAPAGLRYSWVAGDIEGLKSSLKRGDIGIRAALRWVGQIVATFARADIDMMLTRHDPLPGLVTLLDVVPIIGHITRLRHELGLFIKPRAHAHEASAEAVSHTLLRGKPS